MVNYAESEKKKLRSMHSPKDERREVIGTEQSWLALLIVKLAIAGVQSSYAGTVRGKAEGATIAVKRRLKSIKQISSSSISCYEDSHNRTII